MIVVLPFIDPSGQSEQELFAEGMTGEMINVLGNIRPEKLGVIARTSAMHYKNRAVTIETIGSELDVDYVIEGSVRRYGDDVRVSATPGAGFGSVAALVRQLHRFDLRRVHTSE